MKHLGTQRLETDRLILRRFEMSDAKKAYMNWMSRDTVTKYLRWKTHMDISTTEHLLAEWIKSYNDPTFYQWAIVLKSTDEPVGTISLVDRDDICELVEIGYCLGDRWWHQGMMSEALAEVIRFFFLKVGVNRVEARHDAENVHSGGVMKKCGMLYEGTLRESDYNNRGVVDMCIYGLLRDDYQNM